MPRCPGAHRDSTASGAYSRGREGTSGAITRRAYLAAVHGGAANYARSAIGERRARAGLDAVERSLLQARALLDTGGDAIDAVIAAVRVLEDAEELNAGRGAALTESGEVELDAAVADGRGRRAGAVAAVRRVRHPVEAARAVLDDGRHVLLVGPAAEAFAHDRGVEAADPSWFVTERQREALTRAAGDRGTVGAVALDVQGHLAAATSTGGLSGQRPGRIGDTPIIGAGTWADDGTVAVSATGAGEVFVRVAFAHTVHVLVEAGVAVQEACRRALDEVSRFGGDGGCVAVSAAGELALPFSSPAMFHGWVDSSGRARLGLEPGDCEVP